MLQLEEGGKKVVVAVAAAAAAVVAVNTDKHTITTNYTYISFYFRSNESSN